MENSEKGHQETPKWAKKKKGHSYNFCEKSLCNKYSPLRNQVLVRNNILNADHEGSKDFACLICNAFTINWDMNKIVTNINNNVSNGQHEQDRL